MDRPWVRHRPAVSHLRPACSTESASYRPRCLLALADPESPRPRPSRSAAPRRCWGRAGSRSRRVGPRCWPPARRPRNQEWLLSVSAEVKSPHGRPTPVPALEPPAAAAETAHRTGQVASPRRRPCRQLHRSGRRRTREPRSAWRVQRGWTDRSPTARCVCWSGTRCGVMRSPTRTNRPIRWCRRGPPTASR
jgi:hypothetical protein